MAGEKSRRAGKGRAVVLDDEASEVEPESDFRFSIAQIYGLHVDCAHAACKRHRVCSRPATVPCYGKHLRELRRYVFPGLRRKIEQAQPSEGPPSVVGRQAAAPGERLTPPR